MYYVFESGAGEYNRIPKTIKGAESYFYKLKNVYKLSIYDNKWGKQKSISGHYNITEYFNRIKQQEEQKA